MNRDLLYLDHAATTPVRPEARAAMEPFLSDRFGNPSSTHAAGRAARQALEEARDRVAALLGAEPAEICFTGGGTEADNLAVLGRWRAAGGGVAISAVEHSAVRRAGAQAAREGAALTTLAVDELGQVDLDALDEALETPHAVVSVMWGNNETGVLQPVADIAERCRARGVAFHTDAVQAAGHLRIDVAEAGCDLLAMSGHKFGGPKGVGVLFLRAGTALEPLLHGGGQERGLRGGTSNVAGAAGLAAALEAATAELDDKGARLGELRDRLERAVLETVPDTRVHGHGAPRLPHVLSVGVDDVEPDLLLPALDLAGLAVSAGSACHSGAHSPSHVLLAMGVESDAVVRFSLGWPTTADEVDRAVAIFAEAVGRTRALVP